MLTCERNRELFIEALYDELPDGVREEFNEHLASCPECTSLFGEMEATVQFLNRRTRPEPGQSFQSDFWERLKPQLAEQISARPDLQNTAQDSPQHIAQDALQEPDGERTSPRVMNARSGSFWGAARVPSWAYGIAAVLLIAVGIYLGRTSFNHAGSIQSDRADQIDRASTHAAIVTPATTNDSTSAEALAYLDRSKNLLIGIANLGEEQHASLDLTRQQVVSRELLTQASMLKVSLNKPDQQQLRKLIFDLEIVLLQLSNIEVKPGLPAVELVKKGIDQKSILLKINLEQMRAFAKRSSGAPEKKSNL